MERPAEVGAGSSGRVLDAEMDRALLIVERIVTARFRSRARDPACDLDDLLQLARIAVVIARDGYDPTRSVRFTTFAVCKALWRVRKVLARQEEKRRAGQVAISLDMPYGRPGGRVERLGDCIPSESGMDRLPEWLAFEEAAARLPEREMLAVRMAWEGYSQTEIGKALGVSQAQAGRLKESGRVSLRRLLGAK